MTKIDASNIGHIIEGIGFEYGFDAKGEFADFGDELKIRWMRQGRNIEFQVSDYLVGAPEEIFSELIHNMFRKMTGRIEETDLSPAAQEYIERLKLAKLIRKLISEEI